MRNRNTPCCRYRRVRVRWVYHAATENLNPTGVFAERTAFAATDIAADVHLGAGLGEREV